MNEQPKPLETDVLLNTFSDVSASVPRRFRNAPVYIKNNVTGDLERLNNLALIRDIDGKKIIVFSSAKPKRVILT